ncbi:phytoene synthase [Aspergillus indologenus CBS 114.80]|uniref:Bifunctional lycopene cyclase/phytoene synthase n=1 Tax=Aspergillus indologenus CBS 114.80 TaxID=1450541 RepID=A0A2V5IGH0_9EURO|nr:phytoene synthase [Aspergillus indologenus CBS 114.80]
MGYDYVMVHVGYNIPVAVGLTTVLWPFMTRLDWMRIFTMITKALTATIPWDSYLVRRRIWTYPREAVTGYTLCCIPLEEVFFFVIQTYNTGMLYTILTRRLVFPAFVRPAGIKLFSVGILVPARAGAIGVKYLLQGGRYTYMGLILAWACPILLVQWAIAGHFILALPRREMVLSVMLPTTFLWTVDTFSMRWEVWRNMDVEETVSFLLTNVLIKLDPGFMARLGKAVRCLAISSQSMYMGSRMFRGPLRLDLIFLYSFCRVADDLIDNAPDRATAVTAIDDCKTQLAHRFSPGWETQGELQPSELSEARTALPASRLRIAPLQGLLDGLRTDTTFDRESGVFPIDSEDDLNRYAYHVAGTVAASVLDLVFHHFPHHASTTNATTRREVVVAGGQMGQGLQRVNIARDIERDARIGRVYLPTVWLQHEGITAVDVLDNPDSAPVKRLRGRLLVKAQKLHDEAVGALAFLPPEVQGPRRTTIASYMEIGAALLRGDRAPPGEKLQLPLLRRAVIAFRAMTARA